MKIRWKEFEKSMGAKVRRYDACLRMGFWQRVDHFLNSSPAVPLWLPRTFVSAFFSVTVLFNIKSILAHPDFTMAVLALWILLALISHAGLIWATAHADPEYCALWIFPMAGNRIFWRLLYRLVAGSQWLMLEILLIYGVFAAGLHSTPVLWAAAILYGLLQISFAIGLAVLLVVSRVNTDWLFIAAPTLLLLLLTARSPEAERFFSQVLYFGNPLGWVNAIYLDLLLRENFRLLWLLVPVIGVLSTTPFSLRALRKLHLQGAFRTLPARRGGLFIKLEDSAGAERESVARQRHRILNDESLRRLRWMDFGFLERLIAGILRARERVIAELLFVTEPRWTKIFVGLIIYFFLYLCANNAVRSESLEDLLMAMLKDGRHHMVVLISFIASFVLFAMMLLKLVGLFFRFAPPESTLGSKRNQISPFRTFRLYPVNYWETAKVRVKIHSVLCLVLLPLASLFSLTALYQLFLRQAAHPTAILLKFLVLFWGSAFFVFPLRVTPPGLRFWRSILRTTLASGALLVLGLLFLMSITVGLDLALGACFFVGGGASFLYAGALYQKGRC
jgi:hypothetical protein